MLALVEGLPSSSRLHAHVQGGDDWREFWGWSKDRHMFADWLDIYVKAHTEKGKTAWQYPRPQTKEQNRGLVGLMRAIPREGM